MLTKGHIRICFVWMNAPDYRHWNVKRQDCPQEVTALNTWNLSM